MITAIPGNQSCTQMDRLGIQARREAQFASNSKNILSISIYTAYLILYRCFGIVIIISFHLMTYSIFINYFNNQQIISLGNLECKIFTFTQKLLGYICSQITKMLDMDYSKNI